MATISPRALVDAGAELAEDVTVGPFAYVAAGVRAASGCVIGVGATVTGRTTLGERTEIFPLAVVGASPGGQDDGACEIGEACAIREHVTVCAGGKRATRIGSDNLVMIGSVIGAGATVGDHGIFANCTHIGAGATVEDYVRTSAFPVIADSVRVGAYTFVNGYASVTRDVPPFAIVEGDPVRVRGVNAENLRRCGFGDRDIRALKDAFRQMYNGTSGRAAPQAVARLLKRDDLNPHVRRAVEAAGDGDGDADD
ncbi:MAG: hypothetical protein KGY99_09335 [Phycisphaerae bacterium]|nr:hypothetical protein [Phycisphaerae bacterium]